MTEVEQALQTLARNGISIESTMKPGFWIIRSPKGRGQFQFSTRRTRFTTNDLDSNWSPGTEIAEVDFASLHWEPMFPQKET